MHRRARAVRRTLPQARAAASLVAVLLAGAAGSALAHSFAPPYTLPVPFSMYAFGAGAALLLSFAVVGFFATVPAFALGRADRPDTTTAAAAAPRRATIGTVLSVGLLLLCIVSGLFGTQNLYVNVNMTFFWIVFVLGVPYLTALIGDFYAALNPWRAIVDALESMSGRRFDGVVSNAERFAYAPALLLYLVFIWIELFAHVTPRGLSIALLAYTLINVGGAWLWGKAAWFRYGEFFGVLLRLIGMMSVWARPWDAQQRAADSGGRRWRLPFSGLLEARAEHMSLLLFVLFMLSSTAFDGLHGTQPWVALFWKGLYPAIAPQFSSMPTAQQYAFSTQLYYAWQWLSLVVSPLAYFVVFGGFVAAAKWATRSTVPLRELMLRLAFALVPIAFVYHVTHYYTMLLAQGGQIVRLISDPLGRGWNLFGTARWQIDPIVVDVSVIWHTQVALILVGHIASVYLAHVEALQIFPNTRRAVLSQMPMLLLMVLFTAFGLWILSLPLSIGA